MVTADCKTWIEISKSALENNVWVIKNLASGKILMAVVKSNAYGHGLAETSKLFLKFGADWLGVDDLKEAVILRQAGIKAPILVLGYTPVSSLPLAARYRVKLIFYGREILETPSVFKKRIQWHLKIDTGMSRQGVLVSELPDFINRLRDRPEIKVEGALTHFANADNLSDLSYARKQLADFRKALDIMRCAGLRPKIVHASATSAFFALPEASFDLIRVGLGLYGLWPSAHFKERLARLKLRPALSWKTRLVQIKKIKKGTPVGYGIAEKVKKDSLMAVLPVGYYDGFSRGLSSLGRVLINGHSCKILGRISMNLSVVDISDAPKVKAGDEAVLIGRSGFEEITAEEMAQKLGTISYEVVSRINPLLPRFYL